MKLPGFILISVILHLLVLFAWPDFIGVSRQAEVEVQQGLSVLEISLLPTVKMQTPQPQPVKTEIRIVPETDPEPVPKELLPENEPVPAEPETVSKTAARPAVSTAGDEGADSQAAMKGQTMPKYPRMSRIRREEGVVELIADISTTGRCEKVELITSSGFERLDLAALSWARRAKYTPAREGDVYVDSRLKLRIPFELRRKPQR